MWLSDFLKKKIAFSVRTFLEPRLKIVSIELCIPIQNVVA